MRKHTNIRLKTPKGRDHLGDEGFDRRWILTRILKKWNMMAWTGFVWFRIGTSGVLLWTR